jgi:hypothetical protein
LLNVGSSAKSYPCKPQIRIFALMDQEDFYKDQYDKSLSVRAEINGSLSTPIGIITALLAGLYFCATNFDYNDDVWLSIIFVVIAISSAILLGVAIIYLILSFSDFLDDHRYFYLNDADTLAQYYSDLIDFYTNNPPTAPSTIEAHAKKDFDSYLKAELIRNAANNQRTNRIKTACFFRAISL